MLAEDCPRASEPDHRVGPKGYIARHEWSKEMTKTHVQKQCPVCGLWVIWVPKPTA